MPLPLALLVTYRSPRAEKATSQLVSFALFWVVSACNHFFVSNLNTKLLNTMDSVSVLILGKEMDRASSSSDINM